MTRRRKNRRLRMIESALEVEQRRERFDDLEPYIVNHQLCHIDLAGTLYLNGEVLPSAHILYLDEGGYPPEGDYPIEESAWTMGDIENDSRFFRNTHDGVVMYGTEDELVETEGFTYTFVPRGERSRTGSRPLPTVEYDGLREGHSPFDTSALRNMGILES